MSFQGPSTCCDALSKLSERRNIVWRMKSPSKLSSALTMNAGSYLPTGLLTSAARAGVGASSFRMGLSTFLRAERISGMAHLVALDKTETLAEGIYLSLKAMVMSIISAKSGLSVGSPLPEKVMESIFSPADELADNLSSRASLTCAAVGSGSTKALSRFHPHSQ